MSVRLLTININQWARENFAVTVKSMFDIKEVWLPRWALNLSPRGGRLYCRTAVRWPKPNFLPQMGYQIFFPMVLCASSLGSRSSAMILFIYHFVRCFSHHGNISTRKFLEPINKNSVLISFKVSPLELSHFWRSWDRLDRINCKSEPAQGMWISSCTVRYRFVSLMEDCPRFLAGDQDWWV